MTDFLPFRRWVLPLAVIVFALLCAGSAEAQVGVGTTTPNANAALDISSSDKGLLIPRLDSAQRAAITSPPDGLMVFQKDGRVGLWYAFGGAWLYIPDKVRAGDNLGNHTATQDLNLGANQLVGNGGTSGVAVSNGGNVGIGTTTPAQKLEVIGSAAISSSLGIGTTSTASALNVVGSQSVNTLLQGNSTTGTRLNLTNTTTGATTWSLNSTGSGNSEGTGRLLISDTNGPRATFNGSGQLGLGTTSPAARLDIQGGADGLGASDPFAMAFQWRNGGYRHWLRTRHNNATGGTGNDIDFYLNNSSSSTGSSAPTTGTTHVLTLESNNGQPRVGIGTTAPGATLEVSGATSTVKLDGLAGTGTRLMTVDASGNVSSASTLPAGVTGDNLGNHTATTALNLGTNQLVGNGGTTGLYLNSVGNVGLGTTNPSGKIHAISNTGTDPADDYILEDYRNGNNLTQFFVQRAANGTQAAPAPLGDGTTTGVNIGGYMFSPRLTSAFADAGFLTAGMEGLYRGDGTTNLSELRFRTSGANRMILSQTGQLGVGTTSPSATLHVVGSALITGLGGSGTRVVTADASGNLSTTTIASVGDNLGNHTATQKLDLGTNQLVGNGGTTGVAISSTGTVTAGSGSVVTSSEGNGLIADAGASRRVGLMKYSGREGGIWRTSGQDFEIGRTDQSSLLTTPTAFTTDLYVGGTGNVGVGTTSPSAKLHVSGNLRADLTEGTFTLNNFTAGNTETVLLGTFAGSSNNAPQLRFSGVGSTAMDIGQDSSGAFVVEGNDNRRLIVQPTGNVGIGALSPAARLDIVGGADSNGNNDPAALAFQYRAGGYRHWLRTRHNAGIGGTGNDIDFFVNNSTASAGSSAPTVGTTHVLTLEGNNGAARVGIGTTTPSASLEVSGATSTVKLGGLAGTGTRLVTVDASGNLSSSSSLPAGVTGDNLGNHTATTNLNLGTNSLVGNGGTTGLTITNNGRVGLAGVTNPGNGNAQLANTGVNTLGSDTQGGSVSSGIGSLAWAMSNGGYVGLLYNGSTASNGNGLAVKVDGTSASAVALDVSKGVQGSAGTPLLTVRASGNVGIGTNNPSEALSVVGNATVSGTTKATTFTFPSNTNDVAPVITSRFVPATQGAVNPGLQSELILFHSNDGTTNLGGPDQITLRAPQVTFQTYDNTTVNTIDDDNGYNERLTISPAGRVKINDLAGTGTRVVTTDASGNLATTTTASLADNLGNHTATQALNLGANQLVGNGGTTGLGISNAGNVGIGTTSPTEKLTVSGNALVTAGSLITNTEGQGVIVDDADFRRVGLMKYLGREAGIWRARAAGTIFEIGRVDGVTELPGTPTGYLTDLAINDNGLVGIGTLAPAAKLDVIGTETAQHGLGAAISLKNESATVANSWYLRAGGAGTATPDGGFSIADGANYMLQLTQSGRMGVATTTPTATFHVGSSTSTVRLEGLTGVGTRMVTTDASGNLAAATIPIGESTTAGNGLTLSGTEVQLGGTLTSATTIATGGNNLNVTGTGSIGIGTTSPDANYKVHLEEGSMLVRGEGRGVIVDEGPYRRSGFIKYSGHATGFWRADGYQLEFGRAQGVGNDLPGSPTGLVTDMTLDTDGDVGIGVTSPQVRLHVGGTAGTSNVRLESLGGTGTRMVTTDANGNLSTAAVPVDTDAQQLSISGGTISLTNGGSVTVPDASATNELQTISKTGSTVTLSNGGGSFTDTDTDTDAQNLSLSGQSLSISGGTGVTLPVVSATNGLSVTSGAVGLGGTLTGTTTVAQASNMLSFTGGKIGLGTSTDPSGSRVSVSAGSAAENVLFAKLFDNTSTANSLKLEHNGSNLIVRPATAAGSVTVVENSAGAISLNPTAGNVGIGTTATTARLDVNGTARIRSLTATGTQMVTADANGNLGATALPVDTDAQTLSISGTTLSISGGNSVTVPTGESTTASNGLTLSGTDVKLGGTLTGATTIATAGFGLGLSATGQNVLSLTGASATGAWLNLTNSTTGGAQWSLISSGVSNGEGAGKLLVRDHTTGAVRATFDGSGNLGIGITSPTTTLDVAGTARVTGNTTLGGTLGVTGSTTLGSTLGVSGVSSLTGIKLPNAFDPDATYVGVTGNSISFAHTGVSEDFIGYKSNTFYLKDSPGGGDSADPNLAVGGSVAVGSTVTPTSTLQVTGTTAFTPTVNILGGTGGSPTALSSTSSTYLGLNPANAGANNYQLPAASSCPGRMYVIRNNSSSFTAVISTAGGSIYAGNSSTAGSSYTLNPTSAVKTVIVFSDGSNWTFGQFN